MTQPIPEKSLQTLLSEHPESQELLAVDLATQTIHRQLGGGRWESEPVSTSRVGPGSGQDSNRTPCGWHRVTEIIGKGGPTDQEYISRKPVPPSDRDDRILSRILWLNGLEPDLNATSQDRYIYIHGTNHTESLGTPDSEGCIRMHPDTIAAWADVCNVEALRVWIGKLE